MFVKLLLGQARFWNFPCIYLINYSGLPAFNLISTQMRFLRLIYEQLSFTISKINKKALGTLFMVYSTLLKNQQNKTCFFLHFLFLGCCIAQRGGSRKKKGQEFMFPSSLYLESPSNKFHGAPRACLLRFQRQPRLEALPKCGVVFQCQTFAKKWHKNELSNE